MRRALLFFSIFLAAFFYIFLAYSNLCIELQNIRLAEKKMLLERDRKRIASEIARALPLKNLEEAYFALLDSSRAKFAIAQVSERESAFANASTAPIHAEAKETMPLLVVSSRTQAIGLLSKNRQNGNPTD